MTELYIVTVVSAAVIERLVETVEWNGRISSSRIIGTAEQSE